jgi:hypothetical protein
MKLIKSLLVMALAGAAFAQAPTNKNTAPAPAKPAATPAAANSAATKQAAPVKPAAAPVTTKQTAPVKPVVSAAKPTMPATKPEPTAAKPRATKHVAKASQPAKKAVPASLKKPMEGSAATEAAPEEAPAIKRGRDPFVSVIMERNEGGISCAGAGKKCLIVDQVMLKGTVRSQSGAIAVVTSSANKTYFLRENDPVYNGVVVKITPDSIVFRETVTDRLGKSIQREVVKKVNNPAA